MKLLVTNDDGPSVGLKALADAAAERGHSVFIATTSNQSSGSSKSISFKATYRYARLFGKYEGIIVDSTPATAVGVALDAVRRDFDFVASGVNGGPNLGLWDVLSSGTVGAVLEAVTRGLRGIAVSLVARDWSEYNYLGYEVYLAAARLAIAILEELEFSTWEAPLLNLNVPSWGFKGLAVATVELFPQSESYSCMDGVCDMSRWSLEEAYTCSTPGSDVCLVKEGFATISPVIFLATAPTGWLQRGLAKFLSDFRVTAERHDRES